MTNTLPKKVLIGNVPYDIQMTEGFIKDGKQEFIGRINYDKQNIQISDEIKNELLAKTLLHEITHGILQECGMTRFNKEDFVDRLSVALYDFLSRNDLSFLPATGKRFNGGYLTEKPVYLDSKKIAEQLNKDLEQEVNKELTATEKEVKQVNRKLPIDNERSLSVSIKDLQENTSQPDNEEEPNYWKTGIKINKNGEKCYKTRYKCSECGYQATKYLLKKEDMIECYHCRHKMKKWPATAKGFPDRDDWGNFFVTEEVLT